MTPDQTQELLKPRYIVIADWPLNDYLKVGQIIANPDHHEFQIGSKYTTMDDYPHLFRKLEWWEEREESEMPDYVRRGEKVVKIEYHFSMYSLNMSDEPLGVHTHFTYGDKQSSNYTFWQPATESDYIEYTKSKTV